MKAGTVFVMLILGVVIGLAVGLFVGWVIWPVEWINASPANMRLLWQTDWINMSIDSYTVNQNAELAVQRYEALGESGPAALAAVMANPQWVNAENAQAYRDIITEGPAQAGPSLSTEDILDSLSSRLLRPPLLGYFAVALFLAFLAIILLIVLIMRLISSKSKATATEEIPTQEVMVAEVEPAAMASASALVEMESEPALAETESEEELEAEIFDEAMPDRGASIPSELIEETEGHIPDEKRDVDLGLAGLAGVAAAAGIAIAGEAEETEPEAEGQVEKVEELTEEVETAEPLESIAVAGAGAELLWALEEEVEEPVGREEILEEVVEDVAEPEAWIPESEDQKIPEDFYGKYNRKIIEVEGIGEVYSERLAGVGITTTHAFLQSVSTRKGREELAEKTGISSKLILEWANHVDMMRIQGIGPQWSDLLEAVGVDTVRELAMRNPQNLRDTMITVNEEKKLVRQLPTVEMLEDWIEQAKDLPRILTY